MIESSPNLGRAAGQLKRIETKKPAQTKSVPLLRPKRYNLKLALKGFVTVVSTILKIPFSAIVGGVKGAQKGLEGLPTITPYAAVRTSSTPSKILIGTVSAIFGPPAKLVIGTTGALLGFVAGTFVGLAQGTKNLLNLMPSSSLPPAKARLLDLINDDATDPFCGVIAGNLPLSEMFTEGNKESYQKIETAVLKSFQESMGKPLKDHTFKLFSKEDITAAWINKQRFNGAMSDAHFFSLIERGDQLLTGSENDFEKTKSSAGPEKSDTLALMWGVQALVGKEGFEKGATRVRLKPEMAMRLYDGLSQAGAHSRASTHAQLSRVLDNGLGIDIPTESFRKHAPFGLGALLAVPTYQSDADAEKYKDVPYKTRLAEMKKNNKDIDILFKLEDFGFEDQISHSVTHVLKVADKRGIYRESKLVKTAQSKVLTGDSKAKFKNQPSRKEHQSALPKDQQKALQTLSKVLLSKPQFQKYGIKRSVRISSSPFEDKIGGKSAQHPLVSFIKSVENWAKNSPTDADTTIYKSAQLPLGSFIKAVENWAKNSPSDNDTTIYKTELDILKPLFDKAKISDRFEGMEVLRDLTHPDFRAGANLNRALASKDIQNFRTIVADFHRSVRFTTISGSVNSGAPAPSTPSAASQLGKLCDALGLPKQAQTIRNTSLPKLQATLTGMQKTEFAKKDPNSVFLNF
ncbi:hypothetical protein HOH45_07830, partial [bacterium]|nr:hypothetical protein [bacterium]